MRQFILSAAVCISLFIIPANGRAAQPDSSDICTVYFFLDFSCPVCQYYLQKIQAFSDEFTPLGMTFLAVFPTPGILTDTLQYYAGKYTFRLPLIIDTSQVLTEKYNARVTPQAIVVSRTGTIAYSGRIDDAFIKPGRRRFRTTTAELREVLAAIGNNTLLPIFTNSAPVGCIIERKKR